MPLCLGAHKSTAGGLDKAVARAVDSGCDCLQVFTKNSNQWRAATLTEAQVASFRQAVDQSKLAHLIAHDSYLINLASCDDALWNKSIEAFADELRRAEALGLSHVVTHPGAYTTSTEEDGLRRVIAALDRVHRATPGLRVRTLLETTAGQGTCLGARFEHFAEILNQVDATSRVGVCFDTCHVFAAGYAMDTKRNYQATMRAFDRTVGLDQIQAIHINDSKAAFGSRVDRHAHIGQGQMGIEPFRFLLADRRLNRLPMYLETPKEGENGEDMDAVNLALLRSLVA